MTTRLRIGAAAFAAALAACSPRPGPDAGDADSGDSGADSDADSAGDGGRDAEAGDGDADVAPSVCEIDGLPARELVAADDDPALYAVAADFTVPTTEGDWTLSEAWTGCDVYLFIQDNPAQARDWPVPLWDRDVNSLLSSLPRNVHLFFTSYVRVGAEREAALAALQEQLDLIYGAMPEEERAWWQGRVHLITDYARDLPGWLGEIMTSPRWGAGIDRMQRVRYIGSYADPARFDASAEWFAPNLSMAANEALYYNFEAEREARLEEQGATVVPVFAGEVLSDEAWAGDRAYAEVTLPSAAEMERFDTMELDLYLGCDGEGEFGTCPAWDYIVYLYLCAEDDPTACETEIGRWITTYHREGRWVHDVSGLLPLLASGGTRRLAFYTQQPYEVWLSLRLSSQGRPRPTEATFLFSGGAFDSDYNGLHEAVTLAIPAGASRVEIATVISGHGMVMPENCAEFCDTAHHFLVNGHDNVRSFPEIGEQRGCMATVEQGTVPNQYGTWWYGRSGWCPGLEVPMVMLEVTDQVELGAINMFEYEGFYRDEPYSRSGARIVLTSWLVISI